MSSTQSTKGHLVLTGPNLSWVVNCNEKLNPHEKPQQQNLHAIHSC
jgi:hypothetical protein